MTKAYRCDGCERFFEGRRAPVQLDLNDVLRKMDPVVVLGAMLSGYESAEVPWPLEETSADFCPGCGQAIVTTAAEAIAGGADE